MTTKALKWACLLFVFLTLPFVFTSCGNDDEPNSSPLIGMWVDENLYFVKYNSDGTGYDGELNDNETIDFIDENFKWSTDGNKLTIIWEDSGKDEFTYEIKGNILNIYEHSGNSSWLDNSYRRVN